MDKKVTIKKLIDDEVEAVQGYEDAIIVFKGDKKAIELFNHIIKEEQEHINELNELLKANMIFGKK